MPRKPRKPILDFAVFLAVRSAVALIQALPGRLPFRFAELLAALAYRVNRRHRTVAAENLQFAFPNLSAAATDKLVRRTYRHFALMIVELARLPRKMHTGSWRRYGSLNRALKLIGPLHSPRPALLVTAHFGNWEFAGWFMGLCGFKSFAIARVLDNPYLDRYLLRFRQGTGQTIIAKNDDFDRLTQALKSGAKVATLADQDAGPRGVFVDFFGRPASTHKAVALMAIEFDAPLVVVGVPRVAEPMFYSVVCEDVIDPRDYAGRTDAVTAMTQRYSAALERLIRRHPEQYFWFHRRWKHQPAKRERKPAARAA
jgi:KDO2-lipid IV(A) lauroyltransferase